MWAMGSASFGEYSLLSREGHGPMRGIYVSDIILSCLSFSRLVRFRRRAASLPNESRMLYILAQGKLCPSKADSEGEGLDTRERWCYIRRGREYDHSVATYMVIDIPDH